MMREDQPIVTVTPDTLVAEVKARCEQGNRLVQIGATVLGETLELNYTFDREQKFSNLRLAIPVAGAKLPSVSDIYWCAFLYENELHDLFDITFEGLVLDFKGTLYKTAEPHPFVKAAPGVSTSVVQPSA